MQDKTKQKEMMRESPIAKAFHSSQKGNLVTMQKSTKVVVDAMMGKMVRNDAERIQMADQQTQKTMAKSEEKRAKMEQSPLLKAFARQAQKK